MHRYQVLRRRLRLLMATVAIPVIIAGAASAQTPSSEPGTPFKLATFEANGRLTVGLVLGSRLYDLDAASGYLVTAAKVPPVTLPTEMRD